MPKTLRFPLLFAAVVVAAAAPAAAAVYDADRAQAFCASQNAGAASERCLEQQVEAARLIERWLGYGEYPRYISRRAYERCDARFTPDLRQTWTCIDELNDGLGRGRSFSRF